MGMGMAISVGLMRVRGMIYKIKIKQGYTNFILDKCIPIIQ